MPAGTEIFALPETKEALFYEPLAQKKTACGLCGHGCVLGAKESGFCRIRRNVGGRLYAETYARPCAVHIDPIEKKPFFHVRPGTTAYSLATAGCNLRCLFCQNWEISQARPQDVESIELLPETAARQAFRNGCSSMAYTYSEPTVFYEYTLDCSAAAKKYPLINVMHSNGFLNPDPLRRLGKNLTAVNIDLKGFTQDYYGRVCQARLAQVLRNLVIIKKELGLWLELTNLMIPTLNDNPADIEKMSGWIRKNLGPDVPLHFSRFFPMYKLTTLPPTPVSTLEKAREIALNAGLHFVYIGNVPGNPGENTYCFNCKKTLIRRNGYIILENRLSAGKCPYCSTPIAGVWS